MKCKLFPGVLSALELSSSLGAFLVLTVALISPVAAQTQESEIYLPKGGLSQRVVTLVNFGPGDQSFNLTVSETDKEDWATGYGLLPGPPFQDITAEVLGLGYLTGAIPQDAFLRFVASFDAAQADFGDLLKVESTARALNANAFVPFISVDFLVHVMTGDLVLRDLQATGSAAGNDAPPLPPKIGDDIHTPQNPLSAINAATRNAGAAYLVQVENEATEPKDYVVEVIEQGSSKWDPRYYLGEIDITESLRSGSLLFPNMAPGEVRQILAVITPGPEVTVECEQFASIFVLRRFDTELAEAAEFMDAVAAVGEYFGEGLTSELTASPKEDGEFELKLKVTNLSPYPATNVSPMIALGVEGDLEIAYKGPAAPTAIATLAPGASTTFVRTIAVTDGEMGTVSAAARGILRKSGNLTRLSLSNIAKTDVEKLPAFEVTIDPDRAFKKDELFEGIVTVRHTGEGEKTYEFPGDLLVEVPANSEDPKILLELREFMTPEPFVMNEGDPAREFRVTILAAKRGATSIASSIEITDSQGNMTTESDDAEVIVSPFEVTVTVSPKNMLLNQTPADKLGKRATAFNNERVANGLPALKNLFEIEMTVKNDSETVVKNVNVPDVLDVQSFISSESQESVGVPLDELFLYPPEGDRIDLQDRNQQPPPKVDDVSLMPGESVVFAYLLEAYDGNTDPQSDDSLKLEFKALVLGSLDGKTVKDLGTAEFQIIDQPLLEWGIRPRDGRTNYLSGQAVRVEGFIENISGRVISETGEVSIDPSKAQDLIVMVYQVIEGNAGGGFVQDASKGRSNKERYYKLWKLPGEGDERRVELSAILASLPMTHTTKARIRYGVKVWLDTGEMPPPSAHEQAIVAEDWKEEFFALFAPNEPLLSAAEQRRQECEALGISSFLCGTEEGLLSFGEGVFGLVKFLGTGFREMGNAGAGILAWEMQVMSDFWKVIQGDEAALNALIQEAYVQYLTYAELNLMAGQAAGQAPLVFEAFAIQMGDAMSGFFKAAGEGDLDEVQFQVGKFLGENPDLILEPLVIGMGYAKMARALQGEVTENTLKTSRILEQQAQKNSLPERLNKAKANGTPLERAFLPGDKINNQMLREIYGITGKQLDYLKKVAKDNGVVITFRSRNPISMKLLRDKLAWPKPQALKQKTINTIDIKYLGASQDARGALQIIRPPSGIAGKTEDALDSAIDAYMDVLRGKNPELADKQLFHEVRSRLNTRATEWNEYADKLDFSHTGGESKLKVNFDPKGQFSTADPIRDRVVETGGDEFRRVKTTPRQGTVDPVTGETRQLFDLEMTGPGNTDFRKVTGDIDFMSFVEPNGGIIRDVSKRLKIYNQLMAGPIDAQHGESFTFFLQNKRAEYLRCCTPGGEAMVAISPFGDQTPRAAFFVDNLSIIDNSRNGRFLPTRGVLRDSGGEVVLKKDKPVSIRRTESTGEFVVITGADLASRIDLKFVNRFFPRILEETFKTFFNLESFLFPLRLIRFFDDETEGKPGGRDNDDPAPPVFSRDSAAPVLQDTGELITLGSGGMRVWTEAQGWTPIIPEDALTLGDSATLDVAPMSSLSEAVPRKGTTMVIIDQDRLGTAGGFFEIGDRIVIHPGEPNEEFATLTGIDPLIVAAPLVFAHEPGEMIASLGPDTTDRDGDGLSGLEEIAIGTNPDLADTDFDGTTDGDEVAAGTDPLDADGFKLSSFRITNQGGFDVSWKSVPGYLYALEGSTSLEPGSWTVLRHVTALESLSRIQVAPWSRDDRGFVRLRLEATDDSDFDGLSARDERGLGTNPLSVDTDGDGQTDGNEVAIGTDPLDPFSKLGVLSSSPQASDGVFVLHFSSTSGVTYVVESSISMAPGTWVQKAVVTANTGVTRVNIPHDFDTNLPAFFRVRAVNF